MPGLRCNRAGINESRQTMSDEQPIEEIIGWTRNPSYDGNVCRDRAEVDDLLAWMAARNALPVAIWPCLGDWIVGWPGNRHATAPTLRDALIAAVREIAATPDESETA